MPVQINKDRKRFRDVISGKFRKELGRLRQDGSIVGKRSRDGKMIVSVPSIDIPHIVYGQNNDGVMRGKGQKGDVIAKGDPDGEDGEGGDGEGEHKDGIQIQVDMEEIFQFMENELKLPAMKPKPSETYEDIKIKYNNISRVGPPALRHTRRTMLEAAKRLALKGELDKLHYIPGCDVPMKMIIPINEDFRYRQYREVRIPSSKAIIFFARDCSGSMDDKKCDVVSNMAWWIDCWIKRYYEKVERCYIVHDYKAEEVDEKRFYTYRSGGGTMCSTAFEMIADQLKNRFRPEQYNIYVFYFTDGDNHVSSMGNDNDRVVKIISEGLGDSNLIGIGQVFPDRIGSSVKNHIAQAIEQGKIRKDLVRLAGIGEQGGSQKEINLETLEAIKQLLTENQNA